MKAVQGVVITTDQNRIDVDIVIQYLTQEAYWSKGRSPQAIRKSMQHSLCFGVLHEQKTIGFARVLTDYATVYYLCDLFLLPQYQKRGIGPMLIQKIVDHPQLKDLYALLLTRDAHGLYERFGFSNAEAITSRFMFRKSDALD